MNLIRSFWRRDERGLVAEIQRGLCLVAAVSFFCFSSAHAQESPVPGMPPPADMPTASPSPSSSPSASALVAAARSVRITFLPPPLEGTITLGIYNESGQLVRVLHQEAELDEFVIGEDALSTKWDGIDDDGQGLPSGKYKARGFAVGKLKTEPVVNSPAPPPDLNSPRAITVKLMANPLANDVRQSVEVRIGFDDENTFLKMADGLPVFTLTKKGNIQRATLAKAGEKSIDVWQDDGAAVEQLRVSNVDKMMAFDCGEIELK